MAEFRSGSNPLIMNKRNLKRPGNVSGMEALTTHPLIQRSPDSTYEFQS